MGHRRHRLLLSAAVLVVGVAAPAAAIVTFEGDTSVISGRAQRLTLNVPLDQLPGTSWVEVYTPGGWTADDCEAMPPWGCRTDPDWAPGQGYVRWDRDPAAPAVEGEGRFVFTATPGDPGEATFVVHQWTSDGGLLNWSGPPGSDQPAALLTVEPAPATTTTTTMTAAAPPVMAPVVPTTTVAPTTTTTVTTVTTVAARPAAVAVDWGAMETELQALGPGTEVLGVSLRREPAVTALSPAAKGAAVALLMLVGAVFVITTRRLEEPAGIVWT